MTIIEIAKELNVSPSTVSRALNNSHQISKATKTRIDDFVKKINFRPNSQASNLKRGLTKTIAVIIPEISNHFFTLALNAIEEIANQNNFHVLLYQTHENHDKEVEIINNLYNGRVDGVIISVAGSFDKNFVHLENLCNHLPVVFFDRVITKTGMPAITCDDYESGYKATQHLIDKKCTDILFIGLSNEISVTNERLAGYTDALRKNNLPVKDENIICCSDTGKVAEKIKNRLLVNAPDGVFSSVERYTLLLYSLCHELKIKISDELKIISFFNSPAAPLLSPPLSSVIHPAIEMGKAAAEALLHNITNKNKKVDVNITLNCTFQIRESSC